MKQPFSVHPRPQCRRDDYLCLNGEWDFSVQTTDELPEAYEQRILVPFPPESKASGVMRRIEADERMFYRTEFVLPDGFMQERVLLHFGAVDQEATVYLNGRELGSHTGGYLPFTFDITDALEPINTLIVRAVDRLDHAYPWGKQKRDNGGMWYTPFSGIWQTVWIESVPNAYITSLAIETDMESVTLTVHSVGEGEDAVCIETEQGTVTAPLSGRTRIPISEPHLWSPDDPHLYRMTVTHGTDTVASYFALRTVEAGTVNGIPRLLLNGKPVFLHALLDQGYWPDGIALPPDADGYERDILFARSLGFQTIRKHIRIEPMLFYEACDRLGMLVMQDLVNNGTYRFLRDTALPTVGIQRLPKAWLRRTEREKSEFERSLRETVRHLGNTPSIVYWTVFNEGWGQFDADRMYALIKELDDSRIVDTASGWFLPDRSDVKSVHVYFRPYRFRKNDLPTVLSEFGGFGMSTKGKQYGYRFFRDRDAYREALLRLYREQILPAIGQGLCGAVYTQLSDVEEEQNGLISYDRTSAKLDSEPMLKIRAAIDKAMNESIRRP